LPKVIAVKPAQKAGEGVEGFLVYLVLKGEVFEHPLGLGFLGSLPFPVLAVEDLTYGLNYGGTGGGLHFVLTVL
jgi:hypothetical protein